MAARKTENPGFEEHLRRLQEIVATLEGGETTLADGMRLYREGVERARACRRQLEEARHELSVWQEEAGAPADDPRSCGDVADGEEFGALPARSGGSGLPPEGRGNRAPARGGGARSGRRGGAPDDFEEEDGIPF